MYSEVRKFMGLCSMLPHLGGIEDVFSRFKKININDLKMELVNLINKDDFDWVSLAIETKLVYDSSTVSPKDLSIDDLLIFTDSVLWKDIVKSDSILSNNQIEHLKEQFKEIGVQNFKPIHELLDQEGFNWLPFEVKHLYKNSFGEISYLNKDIVFYLKQVSWNYLFPKSLDSERLQAIKAESLKLLQSTDVDQGWTDMSSIVDSLESCFYKLDLYEISKINWGNKVEHKKHYRNPFTLGFKRIIPNIHIE